MSTQQSPYFKAVGDSALVAVFGNEIDLEINRQVHSLDRQLNQDKLDGVVETLPTYSSLLIRYDPLSVTYNEVESWVIRHFAQRQEVEIGEVHRVEVPVVYGGKYGPDLEHVAQVHHMPVSEVIERHTRGDFTVYMMGFTPGFPYLGGLDPEIATPRLESPRTHVPAGSVGIAGKQSGIYPITSPGGWQIIGYTPAKLFDPQRNPPFLLAPGNQVKFISIDEEDLPHDN
jgi:inhibitor of KinA